MKKVKKNNKGFSLVELIVVIAIMAVLMGVLAPQFLKYVEKSRLQKDESVAGEILNATKIALAEETAYDDMAFTGTNTIAKVIVGDSTNIVAYKASADGTGTTSAATMLSELVSTVGSQVNFESAGHNGQSYTITITYSDTSKSLSFSEAWN